MNFEKPKIRKIQIINQCLSSFNAQNVTEYN